MEQDPAGKKKVGRQLKIPSFHGPQEWGPAPADSGPHARQNGGPKATPFFGALYFIFLLPTPLGGAKMDPFLVHQRGHLSRVQRGAHEIMFSWDESSVLQAVAAGRIGAGRQQL